MSTSDLRVAIVVGSTSDLEVMKACGGVLDDYGVGWEMAVISAHRAPDVLRDYIGAARERGIRVLVGGAGAAAHLPGVMAALTTLPVIGVPLAATPLAGVDSLLSIVQMPPGIPVATVAVGGMGARNAGHLAVQILALNDPALSSRITSARAAMREKVVLPEGYTAG